MSSHDDNPPAFLDEEIPLPDDEWASGPAGPVDAPPPEDEWIPAGDDDAPPPPDIFETAGSPTSPPRAGSKSHSAPASRPGSDTDDSRTFDRGVTAKIIGGTEGVGKVGEIFWWGESKYGSGMRAGIKGPGDVTYWVDEEHLGWPEDEVPEDVLAAAEAMPDMGKGDRVRIVKGKGSGSEGVIFWWGESKYGDGMRAGVETDSGDTVWADAADLERLDSGQAAADTDDDIPF